MLSKTKRLTTIEFDEVFKKGRVYHSTLFVTRILVGTPTTKISATIPNKQAKTAVLRNVNRRRIYAAVKILIPTTPHFSAILIAKKTLKDVSLEEIQKDIETTFVKAGVMK